MPKKSKTRREIIMEVCLKHPEANNRTLARLLHERYPHEFVTVEKARSSIRYYRGALGKRDRSLAPKETQQPLRKAGEFTLPKGIKQVERTRHFKTPGRWLMFSDVHIPYHDEVALETMIRFAVDAKCEHIAINGDFFDFYKLSRWDKDPAERDPDYELDLGAKIIKVLTDRFGGEKVFKIGNHEDRYEAYLQSRAPALCGLEQFQLRNILPIEGFQFIRSKQQYKIGKLNVLHGHELPKGLASPVNTGRGVFIRTNTTAIVGHWHRTSTHIEMEGLSNKIIPCYSLGCMCDLTPKYGPINKWNHGFAIVDVGPTGNYQINNHIVSKSEVFST